MQPDGARVNLHGLTARPDLNGQRGVVLGVDELSGRLQVRLDLSRAAVKVRPEHVMEEICDAKANLPIINAMRGLRMFEPQAGRDVTAFFVVTADDAEVQLPTELVRLIMQCMDAVALGCLRRCSHSFYSATSDEQLWRRHRLAAGRGLYMVGGEMQNGIVPTGLHSNMEHYKDGQWTAIPFPSRLAHVSAVALDGRIFIIGGETADARSREETGHASRAVKIYDPLTNTWSLGPPMIVARIQPLVATLDGAVYVVGGTYKPPHDDYQCLRSMERYKGGAWSLLPDCPFTVGGVHAIPTACQVVYRGVLYIVGATTPNDSFDDEGKRVFSFEPADNRWVERQGLHVERSFASASVYKDRIYVIGTLNNDAVETNEVETFAEDTWTVENGFLFHIIGHCATEVNGELWVLGGCGDTTEVGSIDGNDTRITDLRDVWIWCPETDVWRRGPPMWHKRIHASLARIDA